MKYIKIVLLVLFLTTPVLKGLCQETIYYPNGDPGKWTVQVTPFLWLPWISGELETTFLSKSTNVPVSTLLSNLKGAFMINAEVSKGKVFVMPSYVYTKLGSEKVLWTNPQETKSIIAEPELAMNLFGLIIGMHNPISEKLIIDPYLGFRYNSFKTTIAIEGIRDTTSVEERAEFWDPVLGLRTLYYPHPRVPLMFKADIGGFGVGSSFSWTATINVGYTISPLIDLIAGFSAYGTNFIGETKVGTTSGLNLTMYGFNLGVKIIIPKRYMD